MKKLIVLAALVLVVSVLMMRCDSAPKEDPDHDTVEIRGLEPGQTPPPDATRPPDTAKQLREEWQKAHPGQPLPLFLRKTGK